MNTAGLKKVTDFLFWYVPMILFYMLPKTSWSVHFPDTPLKTLTKLLSTRIISTHEIQICISEGKSIAIKHVHVQRMILSLATNIELAATQQRLKRFSTFSGIKTFFGKKWHIRCKILKWSQKQQYKCQNLSQCKNH